jgi:hypothetical protein
MDRFTRLLTWVSEAARLDWYENLFKASARYELTGHKLDALKTLAAGGVESRLLDVQSHPAV